MKLIVPRLLKLLAGANTSAMALFPFILFRDLESKEDDIITLHEKIHWKQQLELLLIIFYILYGLFYLFFRLKGYNHFNAYMSIPFEREAYQNDKNPNYLKERKAFAWVNYLD